ncbi:MAG: hypothetical protein ABIL46_03045 [candidate division WOR-3 bacterium]
MDKPRIILSRCFCEAVRYNGGIVQEKFIERLEKLIIKQVILLSHLNTLKFF